MLAAALLASAATANAAAVAAAPATEFSARGVGLGGLLTSQDGKSDTGYVSIDDLRLGQDLGVDGKSVYVGKDDQGIQLFQFRDGSVAPLTYVPGETKDIPVNNNLCEGCEDSAGHAKREVSIRDIAGSIGGSDGAEQGGNADFGDIKIGEDVGASVGLDGAKYVGKDDDGVQLFQFKDGSVAPIVLSAGEPAEGYEYNEKTGLCDGCKDSEGWTSKRSVAEELELAEREAEGRYEVARAEQPEERFFLTFLAILGLKIKIGKAIFFGPGRWKCNVAHGGYINIKGCRRGTYIGIRHGRYAGCNPRGVQMFHFPGRGVCPLKCSKGPVRHGWKVDKGGYCNYCHHSGWGWGRNGWWKRDEIVEERDTALATRDAEAAQHDERFFLLTLGLLGLKLKVGTALLLGKGKVLSYLAHGGYVNIPRCRPGTHIGIHNGVYVGCNRDGVQMFKWGPGRVGPLRCTRGPVRKGCRVRNNLCDVCHHDGNWWGSRWGRDAEPETEVEERAINQLD
jgi:hypothetical protein